MTELVKTYPDEESWLEARKGGIGASAIGNVMGVGMSSPLEQWLYDTGRKEWGDRTEAMEIGLEMEATILRLLSKRLGVEVAQAPPYTLWRHPEHEWMIATPDSRVAFAGDGPFGAEGKNTGQRYYDSWPVGEDGEKTPPLNYIAQCQQQLEVMRAVCPLEKLVPPDYMILASLVGGRAFRWWRIDPDPDVVREIVRMGEQYMKCVKDDVPPALVGGEQAESEKDALFDLYPHAEQNSLIELPAEYEAKAKAYKEAGKRETAAKKDKESIGNTLRLALGDSEAGRAGIYKVSWKFQQRRSAKNIDLVPADNVKISEFRKINVSGGKG